MTHRIRRAGTLARFALTLSAPFFLGAGFAYAQGGTNSGGGGTPPAPAQAAPSEAPPAQPAPAQTPAASDQPAPSADNGQASPTAATASPAPSPASHARAARRKRHPSSASSSGSVGKTHAARLSLSDGHTAWHPSRSQLGIRPAADGGYTLDSAQARAYLESIAPNINRSAQPAHPAVLSSYDHDPLATTSSSQAVPAKIMPPSPALKLDEAASIAAIKHAIAVDPGATHIALVMKKIGQPGADSQAKLAGIDSRIAHFVTHFNAAEVGRTQTVRRAISLVDGRIVAPGQTFSLNEAVGERTKERGFGEGIVFVEGHLDKQLGGGMCQVATTLFNAILLANLKVIERHQHVRTVPYVKPGQDATVYWGQKDFKFQNNTSTPIYISYRTTATHAICDIYGKASPNVRVAVEDNYRRLGPRHYTAVLKRFVTAKGQRRVDYSTFSAYDWTPALDYRM